MSGSNEDQDARRAGELIEAGAEIVGAFAGTALGTVAGPPGMAAGALGGVAVTRLVKKLGAELWTRLGERQRVRAGAALLVVADRINTRAEAGEELRADDFFDAAAGETRTPAEELLEGTLLHAANAYEEKKIPYMGALFASLAFRPDISPAHAHSLLRLAARLSYRQLAALAYFAENAGGEELDELQAGRTEEGRRPFRDGLGPELTQLGGDDLELLGAASARDDEITPIGRLLGGTSFESTDVGLLRVTERGHELSELMELSKIPSADKRAIFDLMAAEPGGAD